MVVLPYEMAMAHEEWRKFSTILLTSTYTWECWGGHFLLMDVFLWEVGFHLYNCKFHQ
jgi:hypothetical protein